jgi:ubiquitin carboxyl-terminal hydrolase 34
MAKDHPMRLLESLEAVAEVRIGKEAQPRNKYVGIRNLGCICYMNSILQQFFLIGKFRSLIMSLRAKTEESEVNGNRIVDDFLFQLQLMYVHLEWSQKQYYDPTPFCLAVKDFQGKPINTHIQEDAHEFLNTAFDKLEGYCKTEEKEKILERIFGGKTVTEIVCQTCKNKNEVLEHYYHLSVEVKGMKSLKESFEKWIHPEEISEYFCVNCDRKVEKITKQTLLKEAPEILVINLQRIVFDLETFLKVKVHTKLQFEQELDLHNYFSSSCKPAPYLLKGVVIHSGTSEGGHYYSLIKQDGRWFKFNDQSVTPFNENDIGREAFGGDEHYDTMGELASSTNAYILFYERAQGGEEGEQEELKSAVSLELREKVLLENKQFEHQLQLYQPSYFNCLHGLYKLIIDLNETAALEKVYSTYLKVIRHLCTNSDIKNQLINQVKDDFLTLCALLPAQVNALARTFPHKTFGEVICTHNDVNIREIYQKMLTKSILNQVGSQTEEIPEEIDGLLDYLFGLVDDDVVLKNIYRSYQYFEVWKELIASPAICSKMLKGDSLGKFLDLLMGSDSTHSTKDKKRVDFSISEAMPLVPVALGLLQHKLNLQGLRPHKHEQGHYLELSELEAKLLNSSNFYRKVMKSKLDMGLLSPIISLLSFKDEQYSKFILEVLLRALNSNDEIEDKSVVFNVHPPSHRTSRPSS